MKKSVILAAGLGARLKNADVKPLALIDDISLLLRTLHAHEIACCTNTVVVLGWQSDVIEEYLRSEYTGPIDLQFAVNPDYHLSNGISLLCARPFIEDVFILTMADHILDDGIMRLAGGHCPTEGGAALCVDYKLETIFDMEDSTKVFAESNRLKSIGKQIETFNCIDTGVFVGTKGLMDAIEKVYQQKGDASLSEGVQLLADSGKMEVLDIGGCFWQDVDTPEMLDHAEKLLSSGKNIGNNLNEKVTV